MTSTRNRRRAATLNTRLAELAIAAPQVVAHRLAHADATERSRMVHEKIAAFGQGWAALWLRGVMSQQAIATAWWRAMWMPFQRNGVPAALHGAALGMAAAGLAPVRRTAVANAKRLRARALKAPRSHAGGSRGR